MSAPEKKERAPDLDAEQEIDLGRLWRATISRWWLLLIGLVVGAIVGLLVSLGGGKQYKATTEIYLGQPLSPTSSSAISSPPTQLGLATTFVTSQQALLYAAKCPGLPVKQLQGNIAVKPILGLTGTKIGQPAPLMLLSVTGSGRYKIECAANRLANLVVGQFQPYAAQKIAVLTGSVARDKAQLADLNTRLTQAENAQASLAGSAANSQVLSNYQAIFASLSDQRLALQNDLSSSLQQIAAAQNIEQARIVSVAKAVNQGGPSRRSGVVIGAIIGLLIGLLAAVFWEPIAAQVRSHQTT